MFEGKTEIWLSNTGIDDKRAKEIAAELKRNSTATKLILDYNNIGNEGAIAIAAAIKANSALTTIGLGYNNIGNEGAIAIVDALETNCALTTLYLNNNNIGNEAQKVFDAAWVAHKEKITIIKSIDYKKLINSQDTNALTNALATTKMLYIDGTKVDIDDVKKIATALATNETITTIRLVRNNNDDDGVKEIAIALATNKSVTMLDLTHSGISDDGALALADLLITNKNLTTIKLSSNSIGDGGAKRIATALATNKSVSTLHLTHNDISDDGALALADMMITNKNLTTINLSSNSIGDNGAKKIATALATNKTILTLDLAQNDINNDGALALADVFLTNKTLIDIKLSGNKGSDEYSSILAARSDPQMWAISYDQLVQVRDLAMELFGEDFHGKTMRDVNQMIIIPLCQMEKKSYSLSKSPCGCKTDVFVSHSWDELFGEFVDCIIEAYSNKLRKPKLWICAFALLQGTFEEIQAQLGTGETALDQSPFVRALKGATNYLVVRNRKTDLCERIWCICEFIYAKEFDLIPDKTLVTGPDTFADRNTSCVDAQSFDPNDKEKIIKELTEKSSISDIDDYIQEFRSFGTSGVIENIDEGTKNDDVTQEIMTQTDIKGKLLLKDNIIRKQVGELTELKGEIIELKEENIGLKVVIDELKGKNIEVKGENIELKGENDRLGGEIEGFILKQVAELTELKQQVAKLTVLKKENEELKEKNEILKREIEVGKRTNEQWK